MVISGGSFRPDQLKAKEVVSLLLDDDVIEKKCESDQTRGVNWSPNFWKSKNSPSPIWTLDKWSKISWTIFGQVDQENPRIFLHTLIALDIGTI